MRTPLFVTLLTVSVLLTGCTSTGRVASWNQDGDAGPARPASGWNAETTTDYAVTTEVADETSEDLAAIPAGTCYVQAPFVPSPAETIQVLKRPERTALGGELVIPAEYTTVEVVPEDVEGFAWVATVCEDSVDRHLVLRVQEALEAAGYSVGGIDGIMGPATRAGLEYFKRDNGLYGDGLTHDALRALGIDPDTGGAAFASL